MLIGYARVSKADGSQSLDLQRDALQASTPSTSTTTSRPASATTDRGLTAACARGLRGIRRRDDAINFTALPPSLDPYTATNPPPGYRAAASELSMSKEPSSPWRTHRHRPPFTATYPRWPSPCCAAAIDGRASRSTAKAFHHRMDRVMQSSFLVSGNYRRVVTAIRIGLFSFPPCIRKRNLVLPHRIASMGPVGDSWTEPPGQHVIVAQPGRVHIRAASRRPAKSRLECH